MFFSQDGNLILKTFPHFAHVTISFNLELKLISFQYLQVKHFQTLILAVLHSALFKIFLGSLYPFQL